VAWRAADHRLGEARVLVVDDVEANVVLVQHLLLDAGIGEVRMLTDARQAVDTCLEMDPDLLLLDLRMPHMDGIAVLAQLRDVLPADTFLPVVVLTADISVEARERALDLGARDFLTKPFDRVEVVQRVRNLLELKHLYRDLQEHSRGLQAELDLQEEERRSEMARFEEQERRVARAFGVDARTLAYQPIVDLVTGDLVGVEALSRFRCEPVRPPDQWFAEATAVGRGAELELHAIADAVQRLRWLPEPLLLSVNASPSTAMHPGLAEALAHVPGRRMILELTEHAVIEDYDPLLESLDVVRAQGVQIAVDDAGAGYAGLQQILRLRPDIIKLDIHLTRGVDADPVRRAMAAALVTFGSETGAVIVAEGIETATEHSTLQELGVPWGQGFHLGRPGRLEDVVLDLRGRRRIRPDDQAV
jgi:EAL domain-containing protein (putative c-di-GMP-specific phosphodiesterase class I)/CheY-like chemotaxis protein